MKVTLCRMKLELWTRQRLFLYITIIEALPYDAYGQCTVKVLVKIAKTYRIVGYIVFANLPVKYCSNAELVLI